MSYPGRIAAAENDDKESLDFLKAFIQVVEFGETKINGFLNLK